VAQAAPPVISGVTVSEVGPESAKLEGLINPQGKTTLYHFEYGSADCASNPCTSVPSEEEGEGLLAGGSSPAPVSEPVSGLSPGTVYHYRLVAKNGETTTGTDHVFATRAAGSFTGLPDGRAYEQVSPVNKNGGDAEGEEALSKASVDGESFSFGSTFGIPGGVGAQELPLYLGSRNGASGWSTQGLLPPAELGQNARVMGWTPDFSETFVDPTKLGKPREDAIFALSTKGGAPLMIAPYTPKGESFYAGASKDADIAVFESHAKLPEGEAKTPSPAAIAGAPNVYAWDRQSGTMRLASVLNDGSSTPQGAFAGPYDFSRGTTANTLREGGPGRLYYTQEERAVSEAGDVYFTARASGQLYLRVNPSEEQSPLNGKEECTDLSLACTIQVSASQKTNGESPDGADPAGSQPAAFQAASADGSRAFFTSPEKLTDDANTGPEQPLAAIGRGNLETGAIEDLAFIPTHAVGIALDSKYVYWANPSKGTIGRAELADPKGSIDETFIDTGSIECEIPLKSGEFKAVHSEPRWVAVDAGHVYWTNTGCRDGNEVPRDEKGTIGRADIEGTPASVEPEFIKGASNPQGIAVNSEHIYWANRGVDNSNETIGRADIDGSNVDQGFFEPGSHQAPYGIALTPTHIYFTLIQIEAEAEGAAFVSRIPIAGGTEEFVGIGSTAKPRGVAVQGSYLYWVAQGEEAIGRIPLADFPKLGNCGATPNCNSAFAKVKGALNGLAADSQHLYWSTNGEAPTNPGNDLYLFEPPAQTEEEGTLSDLTATEGGNGAEVKGVLGASADGSRVYFVANAVLATGAAPGSCKGGSIKTLTGSCSLYLWEEGQTSFVARLRPGGGEGTTDALDWVGAPRDVFGGNSYRPKGAFLTPDGSTLLFRSQEKLSAYDNEGAPELYRFRIGDPAGIRCVSCPPAGEAGPAASLGSVKFPGTGPQIVGTASVASRNFSADGNRAFFETAAALSPEDTNGKDPEGKSDCPAVGAQPQQYPACTDVYEWEAPGTGSCQESSTAYSPLNAGCIYLISTGKSKFPSLFGDASASGKDVFFFTRQGLVGQDKDELQDAYDARVGGGLAAQNPVAVPPCESAEACHEPAQTPPVEGTAGSATFVGPANPAPKHKKHKHKKHKKHKKKQQKHNKGRQGR